MLVLTRKAKQQVQIGPDVTITILQIKGQAVRVGIEAPKDVCVLRTEVANRMDHESNQRTVQAAREKFRRENEISLGATDEDTSGRGATPAKVSSRCRASRVEVAPVNSPYQSTSPASHLRPRRRRIAMQ
jgi:carbon storage regulator CsrA